MWSPLARPRSPRSDPLTRMFPANRDPHEGRRTRLGACAPWVSVLALVAALGAPSTARAQSFTITASAGTGGSIAPSGAVVVSSGADQAFVITPDACYTISDVQVDGVSVGTPPTYTFANVTADRTIAASFALQSPTVSVTSDVNPSPWGQAVTFTATVTPSAATGTITFKDSLTTLATVALSGGTAQIVKSNLFAGNHTQITASYSGDACYAPKTSAPYSQRVSRAASSVSLASNVNPSVFTQTVTLTATVTPAGGTGRVTIYDAGSPIGTAAVNSSTGLATLNVGNFVPGTHSLTTTYPGDAHLEPDTSATYDQVVDKQATSIDLSQDPPASACQQTVTLTASLTPSDATGSVELFDGATSLGTAAINSGIATLAVSTLPVGTRSITASYGGDTYRASGQSSPISHDVSLATPAIVVTTDVNPSAWGQEVTVYATMTPSSATGTITFKDSLTTLGTATLAGGVAEIFKHDWYTGNHTSITATYSGDACFTTKTSTAYSLLVSRALSNVSLVSDTNPSAFSDMVTLYASVHPIGATGRVGFYSDSNLVGTAAVNSLNGLAILKVDNLLPGNHTLTAGYPGDSHVAPGASGPYDQVVSTMASSTALSSNINPSESGEQVTLTATVSPNDATGTVNFLDGATSIGSAPVNSGVATLAVSTLSIATHSLTASYGGCSLYTGSTSPTYSQDVVISHPPVVNVTWPNGGENLDVGSNVTLTWTATDNPPVATVTLDVSRDDGATWTRIATDIANSGSYAWAVVGPGTNTGATKVYSALLRVAATDGYGVTGYGSSTAPFSLFDTQVSVIVTPLGSEALDSGIRLKWSIGNRSMFARLELERSPAEVGPWATLGISLEDDAGVTTATDRTVEAGKTYYYRLLGTMSGGAQSTFGLVKATAWAPAEFALSFVWPNPTRGPLTMQFTVPRESRVKLSVLDLQGREVAPLTEGSYPAGRFQVDWDGRSDRGTVPTGLYFVQLVTPDKRMVRRVTIAR